MISDSVVAGSGEAAAAEVAFPQVGTLAWKPAPFTRTGCPGVSGFQVAGAEVHDSAPAASDIRARIETGAVFAVDDAHEERAIYVEGAVWMRGYVLRTATLAVLRRATSVKLAVESTARVMIVVRLAGERHIEWNFVSSSRANRASEGLQPGGQAERRHRRWTLRLGALRYPPPAGTGGNTMVGGWPGV